MGSTRRDNSVPATAGSGRSADIVRLAIVTVLSAVGFALTLRVLWGWPIVVVVLAGLLWCLGFGIAGSRMFVRPPGASDGRSPDAARPPGAGQEQD
jgi:hypothetical protein